MYSFCPNALLPGPYGLLISLIVLGLCPLCQPTQKFARSKSRQCYARLGLQIICHEDNFSTDAFRPTEARTLRLSGFRGIPGKYVGLLCLRSSLLLIFGIYVENVRECCLLMPPHGQAEINFLLWRRRSLNELVSQSGIRFFLWWWEYNFFHL